MFARRLPSPVRRVLGRCWLVASRRRRILALPAIVGLHVAILTALAFVPPPPQVETLVFLDLSPRPGEGPASPIAAAPKPPASGSDSANEPPPDPSTAAVEPAKTATEAKPEVEPQKTAKIETEQPAKEPIAAEENDPPFPAAAPSKDVLAMVEAITGADASAVAAPTSPVASISAEQLAELRLEAFRAQALQPGGGCAIDAALKQAFSTDAAVQAELLAIPSTDKSVSNALQLWDGNWTSAAVEATQPSLSVVQATTIATVSSAPRACRDAYIQGPRFIVVPVVGGADMVIVMGSGVWRWRDVLPDRPPALLRWLGLKG